jgi:pimeloyl-ACP methyl ester carboxylesterase
MSNMQLFGQKPLPEAGRYADINGMKMYYEIHGKGEPLLLLHGFFDSGQKSWGALLSDLSAKHKVIMPDLRGHGRSANPTDSFTHRQSADDVYRLLDHLQIKQIKAMGISTGGMTLLHMATRHPNRVRAMVLIGATHYFPQDARDIMKQVGEDGTSPFGDLLSDENLQQVHFHGLSQIRKLRRQFNSFKDSYDDMNFTPPFLGRITAKTLIIHGDRDVFFPVTIPVEMYKAIPDAALWIVPNGQHEAHLDMNGNLRDRSFTVTMLGFLDAN